MFCLPPVFVEVACATLNASLGSEVYLKVSQSQDKVSEQQPGYTGARLCSQHRQTQSLPLLLHFKLIIYLMEQFGCENVIFI